MKEALSQTLVAIFFGLCLAAKAQSFDAMRPDTVYHPETVLDPASLLSPGNFSNIESGRYVVVEGYIDYRATTWPEPDGDYHFEMQTTNKLLCPLVPSSIAPALERRRSLVGGR